MSTQQQFLTTLNVDGVDYGVWDTMSSPDVTAPEVRHRPGGMGPEKTYRSLGSFGTTTLGRVFEIDRDNELLRSLQAKAGSGRVSITDQPLDADGHPYGQAHIYIGRLGGVKPGATDSNSSTLRMYEVDIYVETSQ